MRSFLIALSFLTRIPVNIKGEVSSKEFYGSLRLLPLVGLAIGLTLWIFARIVSVLSFNPVKAFLTLAFFIYLTGGLHLDGLADTGDALLSSKDRTGMFEVMKDSRLGTFGAIFLVMSVLGLYVGFCFVFERGAYSALLFMPVVGRLSAIVLGSLSGPAEQGGGLGKGFCGAVKVGDALLYSVLVVAAVFVFDSPAWFLSACASVFWSVWLAHYFKIKLGGITGDQLGYAIETSQTLFLMCGIIFADIPISWPGPLTLISG